MLQIDSEFRQKIIAHFKQNAVVVVQDLSQVTHIICSLSPCQTRRRSRGVCVAFLNFLNFSRTPRELQEKMILFVKKASHGVLTASSWRPRGVLVASNAFLRSSHCVLRSSMWRSMELARRVHCVCAALLAFAPRFHGVRTALPRRSSTALTACRQNRNKDSLICTFVFKKTA